MSSGGMCRECGTAIPADSPGGFCAQCLLRLGLGLTAEAGLAPLTQAPTPTAREAPTQTPAPVTPLAGTKVQYFGDYELLEEIARGGMGVVFKARQVSLNRLVALKLISAGALATPDLVKRFKAEAEAAASLSHPNIVPIHEIGEHQGQHYFSMGLIEGRNLRQALARRRSGSNQLSVISNQSHGRPKELNTHHWSLITSAKLVSTIARAVHYAHQRAVLHRDLKPSNILLDAQGEPHLTDFGLAKLIEKESTLTHTYAVLGTPAYMSPEQARGATKDVTTAADVYGLGAVLYEALTGSPPFAGGTSMETIRQVLDQEPRRPSILNPNIDRDLETICLKCLEKDPQRRYASADALANDLDRWLNREPIQARPTTGWERTIKWTKRKPAIASLTGLLLICIGLGVSAVIWQWRNAVKAREEATQKAFAEARARERADEALAVLEIQRAEEFFAAGDSSRALAYLARVLRQNPANEVAAARVLSALTLRRFSIPLTEPFKHAAAVFSVQFSLDGQRVVTASLDKTARVWDAKTGQPLTEPLKHEAAVHSAEFSPDGLWVVTASWDGKAQVWDAKTGQAPSETLTHESGVVSAQLSPDGQRVVTASNAKTARVWDAKTGQPLAELVKHDGAVVSAQFSPDGQRVVTKTSEDETARVWDAKSGHPLTEPLNHEAEVYSAQFSPDSQRVVTASKDKSAQVWDAKTGQPLTEPLKHEAVVWLAQFSPDGRRVVTASGDTTARVWDARTGQPLTEPLKHDGEVHSAQFSPDGQRVLTVSWRSAWWLWEVPNVSLPVPEWLPKLMQAIVGKRFNDQSVPEPVSVAELQALKKQLSQSAALDVWTRWAKWFFAEPAARTISPFSDMTVADFVQHRIEENTLEGLQEAVKIAPANGLALARLGRAVLCLVNFPLERVTSIQPGFPTSPWA